MKIEYVCKGCCVVCDSILDIMVEDLAAASTRQPKLLWEAFGNKVTVVM